MFIEIDFGNNGFKVKASIVKEGNQWCVLGNGEDFHNTNLLGFGDTIPDAINEFKCALRLTSC